MSETPPVYVAKNNLRSRLGALMEAVLQDSRVGKAFQPVILNLARSFLAQATDAELHEGILKIRDEVIPFLLDEENEDQNPQ